LASCIGSQDAQIRLSQRESFLTLTLIWPFEFCRYQLSKAIALRHFYADVFFRAMDQEAGRNASS
jgi:hypothetical protein